MATDTLVNWRKLPTPSGVSAEDPDSFDFFGDGEQRFISQSAIVSAEMFQGNTAFRPVDWLVRITGVYNYNDITLRSASLLLEDIRDRASDWDQRPDGERADLYYDWEGIVGRLHGALEDDVAGDVTPEQRVLLKDLARRLVESRPRTDR